MNAEPERVIAAADWHRNTKWAVHVIGIAPVLLPDEHPRRILHFGDFGISSGPLGRAYIRAVEKACADNDVILEFLDGNHEDFTIIGRFDPMMSQYRYVMHLPRGTRWQWHGRTWVALGGAVSLDRAVRLERDWGWWPEEEITEDQAAAVIGDGPADVMVTHDCPAGVRHSFPPPLSFWDDRDLARSDVHRERLQRVVDAVRPRWLMHGHLHRAYQRQCDFGYGPVEVTGLDRDGGDNGPNYAVLNVRTMTWEETGS